MSRNPDLVVLRAKKSPLQNALQRAHVNRSRQRTGALLERSLTYCWFGETGSPVFGLRIKGFPWLLLFWLKLNMPLMVPAMASNEP